MKQLLQNLKSGSTDIVDVPCPGIKPGYLLIKSRGSLISVGRETERVLLDFSRANLLDKARQPPEKMRPVTIQIGEEK